MIGLGCHFCSENVGLLGLTRVGSRRCVQISCGFMIFFSIFGNLFCQLIFILEDEMCVVGHVWLGSLALQANLGPFLRQFHYQYLLQYTASYTVLLVSIFYIVIPAIFFFSCYLIGNSLVLLSPSAATGISFIQFTNNNSMRNIYVLGVSLFLGISIPQYFILKRDAAGNGPIRTKGGWVKLFILLFWIFQIVTYLKLLNEDMWALKSVLTLVCGYSGLCNGFPEKNEQPNLMLNNL